jgi:hypothetical protein
MSDQLSSSLLTSIDREIEKVESRLAALRAQRERELEWLKTRTLTTAQSTTPTSRRPITLSDV